MANTAPIGIFDSGIGGLTVAEEVIRLMPHEHIIYFGDTARAPYGARPVTELIKFAGQILDFLASHHVKLAIFACNTTTMWALEQVRPNYPFPLIGMNTGAKLALEHTNNKRIGIVATTATINSGKHAQSIIKLDPTATVIGQDCPLLCPLVESGMLSDPQTDAACSEYFSPLKQAGVDTIILACTHYPFLMDAIKKITEPTITLIDPARQTALDACKALEEQQLAANPNQQAIRRFYFSGEPATAQRIAQQFMSNKLPQFEQMMLDGN